MPSTTAFFAFMNRTAVAAFIGLGVATVSLPAAEPAAAANAVTLTVSPTARAATEAYWTPERFANAKPMVMISKSKAGTAKRRVTAKPPAPMPGGAPTFPYDPAMAVNLYIHKAAAPRSGVAPALVGTGGFPFTVNQLYPVPNTFKAFPYSLVGQLFFTIPGQGDFVCSASVIRFRVIATAGHCVSDGNRNFFANWVFVPALHFDPAAGRIKAPYGIWHPAFVTTTNVWFTGGGTVPNIQDDALLVLRDKVRQGVTERIGDVVGFFGFAYDADPNTHITQLGYPCNLLDNCRSSTPIANYAQVLNIDTNNFEWGSAEMGGSSGGPEVQDFGVAPAGILGGNIVISVTSFLLVDTPPVLVDGGSIFGAPGELGPGNSFGDLISLVCSIPGNC